MDGYDRNDRVVFTVICRLPINLREKDRIIMANTTNKNRQLEIPEQEYETLVDRIDNLWISARNRAANAVNKELLDSNWLTGQYIVEFEQKGKIRA